MLRQKCVKLLSLLAALTASTSVCAQAADVATTAASSMNAPVSHEIPAFPELPSTWNRQFLQDPAFNSPVMVVQSGIQHPNTILLIHGLGQNGLKDWIDVMLRLEKNYHVIALDLPGFGYSPPGDGRYTPTRYAALVKNILAHYRKGRVIVVGHSLGGAVALRFAALYPLELSQLVLVDAAGILERTAFLKHNTAIPRPEATENVGIVKHLVNAADHVRSTVIQETGFALDPMRAAYQSDETWQWLVSDSPNTNAAFSLVFEDFASAVHLTAVPTTIVWGRDDRVAPLRTGKVLARRMPQAQLEIIEGAGHVPMRTHLEQFMGVLQSAIARPPQYVSQEGEPSPDAQKDILCDNQRNVTYTGHYRHVVLRDCTQVTLTKLSAIKLSLEHSKVVMEDVVVNGGEIGIEVNRSNVEATNVNVTAARGITVNGSRLDLAGVNIVAQHEAIAIDRGSRLIISTSKLQSTLYQGYAHGAFKLKQTSLDRQLAEGMP